MAPCLPYRLDGGPRPGPPAELGPCENKGAAPHSPTPHPCKSAPAQLCIIRLGSYSFWKLLPHIKWGSNTCSAGAPVSTTSENVQKWLPGPDQKAMTLCKGPKLARSWGGKGSRERLGPPWLPAGGRVQVGAAKAMSQLALKSQAAREWSPQGLQGPTPWVGMVSPWESKATQARSRWHLSHPSLIQRPG